MFSDHDSTGIGPPVDNPLEVRGLQKSFGKKRVLRDIDLKFPRGTTTVVLGVSGAGKSVLLKHLVGLMRPDEGQILVEGTDIVPLDDRAMRKMRMRFGMVFQFAALFDSMSVWENVAFPLLEHTRKSRDEIDVLVKEKLRVVGLVGEDEKFPSELSGGMRKRVGLARAMITDPSIVLWDEPTTGLDPISTQAANEMIRSAQEYLNATNVVISHDIGAAFQVADQIAVLYEGEIVAKGTPDEVRVNQHHFVRQFLDTWFSRN